LLNYNKLKKLKRCVYRVGFKNLLGLIISQL
jgi:hypothetical protein